MGTKRGSEGDEIETGMSRGQKKEVEREGRTEWRKGKQRGDDGGKDEVNVEGKSDREEG